MARHHRTDDSLNSDGVQDSFLDMTANIVGILILLVVVVGVRAAMQPIVEDQADKPETPAEPILTAEAVEQLGQRVAAATREVLELRTLAQRLAIEARQFEADRDELTTYVAAVEAELEKEKQKLDKEEQERLELRAELSAADAEYDELVRERLAVLSTPSETKEIVHTPTPIIRRQSTTLLHLRLDEGRVAVVPFEKLTQLALDRPADARRRDLERSDGLARTEPINGFELLYAQLVRTSPPGPGGARQIVGMLAGEIHPVRQDLGESVADALRENSELARALDAMSPRDSIVMIWTYANSVKQYRELQKALRQRGFAVDMRLLADGRHIAFSPEGRGAAAQ